ncbi:protein boule-like [Rhopilema esculentum]|uniref:protein boule-like n=1 Tax=Rhopilema esculentum TaxID=499914 RepID=UPI0031CF5A2C|eukprot:gene2272-17885_t
MDMTTLKNAVNNIAVNPGNDPHSVHKANPGETDIPNRVFVKGFPREASEDDLKIFFEEYGMVHESKIVKDKSGTSKGYAFITFDSQTVAEKVKLLGNVEYEGKEIVVGPARVRQKRSSLFKGRPEQLWQSVVPGVQQPVYYSVSQDGSWYFQPPTPQIVSVVPTNQMSSYTQANYLPSNQYQLQAYPQGQVQYTTSPVTAPVVSTNYPVGNVGDLFKVARKTSGTVLPLTPPESPEYTISNGSNCSPVQCVPVYEGSLIGEEPYVNHAGQAENIVMLEPADRKLKRVIMKRDGTGRIIQANPCTVCNGPTIPNVSVNTITNTTMTHEA